MTEEMAVIFCIKSRIEAIRFVWVVKQWSDRIVASNYEFPVGGGHTMDTMRKKKKQNNNNDKNKLRRPYLRRSTLTQLYFFENVLAVEGEEV